MNKFRGRRNPRVRQVAMAVLDAVLLGGLVAKWTYRWGWHGNLKITNHTIWLPTETRLPAPLTVAFASDFHAGPTTHPELYTRLAQELAENEPDVVLLGGDFVSLRAEYVAPLVSALSRYNPPLGRFAVLGNHDLWTDDEEISRQLIACGVEVLVNRNISLEPPFDRVSICGIDDPWTGEADSARTFDGAKDIRIWLTHSPDGLSLLGDHKYDVAFAGHTHGGQICLRDGTPLVRAGGPLSRSHSRGRFDVPGNGPLIVSRGVGCSNLPLRINSDPELIICELR
ncbi:MAG TPA: metallophosphoesterase [Steroidobacteraceae bacterium]|nr:metallophosphoesterase [Steroidobacteraceae bacterium]